MISVIMGVYNTKKDQISKAIDSILNQTYTDFEYIICNDGCTDDTFSFIQEKYDDSRIVWIENDNNMGLAYTLNHCLSVSKGEYIARMDSDDFSYPNRFEKQLDVLLNNSCVDIVNCNVDVFDDDGIYGERRCSEWITISDFLMRNPIVHPAMMGRKTAFEKVGGYLDEKYTYRTEDYDMFLRMYKLGIVFYTVQEKLFCFREDKNSLNRRKYKYRVNEYLVKYKNFKSMNMLPRYYLYCLKPLIVGLLPAGLIKRFRN